MVAGYPNLPGYTYADPQPRIRRELRSFIKSVSLIPCKGYGGILPPVQDLAPPVTTAAPAPDDRRRAIWAFMTVRPTRAP